jgi:hypothetical protein
MRWVEFGTPSYLSLALFQLHRAAGTWFISQDMSVCFELHLRIHQSRASHQDAHLAAINGEVDR